MTKNDYKNRRKWLQKQTKMTKITKKTLLKMTKKKSSKNKTENDKK